MMFGTGEPFTYVECTACGSLALADPPARLEDHYPADYAPFAAPPGERTVPAPTAEPALRLLTDVVLRSAPTARLATDLSARLGWRAARWFASLGGLGLTTRSAVLDVGCGSGHRLGTFRRFGFGDLTGTDQFLPEGGEPPPGVTLSRRSVHELPGPFDLVMLHHSLEHMPDPASVLARCAEILSPGGVLLVRVPLAGSYAWRTYGVDWVQLDAPRHLLLFTEKALVELAARCGFTAARVLYDSDAFQFWGSELYRRGLPLHRPEGVEDPASLFPARQLRAYEREARRLNRAGDGDQATFVFRPSPRPTLPADRDASVSSST